MPLGRTGQQRGRDQDARPEARSPGRYQSSSKPPGMVTDGGGAKADVGGEGAAPRVPMNGDIPERSNPSSRPFRSSNNFYWNHGPVSRSGEAGRAGDGGLLSGFTVVVCLSDDGDGDVRERVAQALEPYRIDEGTGLGGWDYWEFDVEFLVRAQFDGASELIGQDEDDPLRCAGGPKRMLDIVTMRRRTAKPCGRRGECWWTGIRLRSPSPGSTPGTPTPRPNAITWSNRFCALLPWKMKVSGL
jgi:hypothetical protein